MNVTYCLSMKERESCSLTQDECKFQVNIWFRHFKSHFAPTPDALKVELVFAFLFFGHKNKFSQNKVLSRSVHYLDHWWALRIYLIFNEEYFNSLQLHKVEQNDTLCITLLKNVFKRQTWIKWERWLKRRHRWQAT